MSNSLPLYISDATWDVTVYTTNKRYSGTDASVYIILMGKTEDGEEKQTDKHSDIEMIRNN